MKSKEAVGILSASESNECFIINFCTISLDVCFFLVLVRQKVFKSLVKFHYLEQHPEALPTADHYQ